MVVLSSILTLFLEMVGRGRTVNLEVASVLAVVVVVVVALVVVLLAKNLSGRSNGTFKAALNNVLEETSLVPLTGGNPLQALDDQNRPSFGDHVMSS